MPSYLEICEEIYLQFKQGKLSVDPNFEREFGFQLNFVPDPYLFFAADRSVNPSASHNCLHVVTTNPGEGIAEQERGSDFVSLPTYAAAAENLVNFYRINFPKDPKRRNSSRRIEKMASLAKLAGYDGVMQLDVIPWHSPQLNKTSLPEGIGRCMSTTTYVEALRTYPAGKPALALDALGTNTPASKASFATPWLKYKCEVIGLIFEEAEFCPIVFNARGPTCGVLVSGRRGICKAIFGNAGE